MNPRKWKIDDLRRIVKNVYSLRQVIKKLGLVPAGGNYQQIKKYIKENNINISHFKGKGWNKGLKLARNPRLGLEKILIKNGTFQSYKLKKRLFASGLKKPVCELCGWSRISIDGRIPLEIDHINGDGQDNRLVNLRILCPNCHSLQTTHRGRNIKKAGVAEWYTRST